VHLTVFLQIENVLNMAFLKKTFNRVKGGFGDPNEALGFGFSITPLLHYSITPVNDRFKFKV
jgi:hypothetical protein